jgi:hypothetical protein
MHKSVAVLTFLCVSLTLVLGAEGSPVLLNPSRSPQPDTILYDDGIPYYELNPPGEFSHAVHFTAPESFELRVAYFTIVSTFDTTTYDITITVMGCHASGEPNDSDILGGPWTIQRELYYYDTIQFDLPTPINFNVGDDFCIVLENEADCEFRFDEGTTDYRTWCNIGYGWYNFEYGDLLLRAGGVLSGYADLGLHCLDLISTTLDHNFFYTDRDSIHYLAHVINDGTVTGLVDSVAYKVWAQRLRTNGNYQDSALVFSEKLVQFYVNPGETVLAYTQGHPSLLPGVYEAEATVYADDDMVPGNESYRTELRIYDPYEGFWMYNTDRSYGDWDRVIVGQGKAMKYVPAFFPVTVDSVRIDVYSNDYYEDLLVWVAEIDPVTGLPGDTLGSWNIHHISGAETRVLRRLYGPIGTVESRGFFVACEDPMGDIELYLDFHSPHAVSNHCVEQVGYRCDDPYGWYATGIYDGFLWAHISPGPFQCGDANGDDNVTSGDGYYILNYFGAGPAPVDQRAADVNGDCGLTTGDGYQLLNHFGSYAELECDNCWPGCTNCD